MSNIQEKLVEILNDIESINGLLREKNNVSLNDMLVANLFTEIKLHVHNMYQELALEGLITFVDNQSNDDDPDKTIVKNPNWLQEAGIILSEDNDGEKIT